MANKKKKAIKPTVKKPQNKVPLTPAQQRAYESYQKTKKIVQQRKRRVAKQGYDVSWLKTLSANELKAIARTSGAREIRRQELKLRLITPVKIRARSKLSPKNVREMIERIDSNYYNKRIKNTDTGTIKKVKDSIKFQSHLAKSDAAYLETLQNDEEEQKMASFSKMTVDHFRQDLNETIMKTRYWQLGNEILSAINDSLYDLNGEEQTAEILKELTPIRDEYFSSLNSFYAHSEQEIQEACKRIILTLQGGMTQSQQDIINDSAEIAGDAGSDYEDGIPDTQMYKPVGATVEARQALSKAIHDDAEFARTAKNVQGGDLNDIYAMALYSMEEREILENISVRLPDFKRYAERLSKTQDETKRRQIGEHIMDIMLGRT